MNKQQWIIVILALGLMGGTAGLLTRMHAKQRLGRPGVKTSEIPDSQRLQVELPKLVLDYTSRAIEPDKTTLGWLPQDTSFGQRVYRALDGFETAINVVLMGRDRTSLHKTEFCLQGQGWVIDRNATKEATVRMDRPFAYDLPVTKFIATKEVSVNGQTVTIRSVYVLWFVADNDEYTARHWQRMWWMAENLLRTGVLQRWAYVSCFAVCAPGQEEATFGRMKQLLAAAVPEFQLTGGPAATGH